MSMVTALLGYIYLAIVLYHINKYLDLIFIYEQYFADPTLLDWIS